MAFFIDKGNFVGAVYLDMKKAFDLVDHNILRGILALYNFHDEMVTWIQSNLSYRTQQEQFNFTTSSPAVTCIKNGVPQGPILGSI